MSRLATGGITVLVALTCAALVLHAYVLFVDHHESGGRGEPVTNAAPGTTDALGFVCEVTVALPVEGVGRPPRTQQQTIVGGIDFASSTGWYAGPFSMSETRKGTLSLKGGEIIVSRPTMIQRFDAVIITESFTLNRQTGEFRQYVALKDGQELTIMKGGCGRLVRAPF